MNVHSIDILAVTCSADGLSASIFGTATIDGARSVDFRIDVTDEGEPGSSDTYQIRLSNGYDSGLQTLVGGNIQIHKAKSALSAPASAKAPKVKTAAVDRPQDDNRPPAGEGQGPGRWQRRVGAQARQGDRERQDLQEPLVARPGTPGDRIEGGGPTGSASFFVRRLRR